MTLLSSGINRSDSEELIEYIEDFLHFEIVSQKCSI